MKKEHFTIGGLLSPHSLRTQLLSRTLLILALVLLLVGFLQYLFMQEVIYRNKAMSLQSQVLSIPPPAWKTLTISTPNERLLLRYYSTETTLAFIDTEGSYSVLSDNHDNLYPLRLDDADYDNAMENTSRLSYQVVHFRDQEHLVVLQPVSIRTNSEGVLRGSEALMGVVQISTPTAPLKALLLRQLFTFLFLSLLALLLGLALFSPLLKKTLVPLSNMVDTAGQIDAGNLDRRFPIKQGQEEIDRLSESFNGMLERLEASFKAEKETQAQMRQFIADASHELRTPLTSIHGFLEVLLRGAANQPEELEKALKSMHSESQRLNKLIHDLLLLSRMDRTPQIEVQAGFLDEVVREMEPQLRILAGSRQLSLNIQPRVNCLYNSDQIKQVILNLFQNAVQHTDPVDGHIRVFLGEKDKGALLSLQDNGPGIGSKHIANIFDRFYRSDSSRTRKYGGAGLGLAITKSIVDAHQGVLEVESQEGQGCTFTVWLPSP